MKHRIVKRTKTARGRTPYVCYVLQKRRLFWWVDHPYHSAYEDLPRLQRLLDDLEVVTTDEEIPTRAKEGLRDRVATDTDTDSEGNRLFSAEEVECKGIEVSEGAFSGCDQSGGDCPVCGK